MILAVVLAGAGTMSCNRSDLQTPTPGTPGDLRVEVALSPEALSSLGNGFTPAGSKGAGATEGLVVTFGGEETSQATKSTSELTTAEDAKIHNLWAIQFKADGTLLGKPFYTTDIPAAGAGSTGVDATYSLAVNLTSNTDANGKVYFIANTNSPNTFNETNAASETKLKEVVKNIGTELKPTAAGGIPMLGVYTGAVQSSGTLPAIPMKRLAAKVTLKYKVDPAFAGFTVTGVQLRNAAANIAFGAEPTGIFPAKATGSHVDYPAEDLTQATTDGDYKKFVWYVPENHRDVLSSVVDPGDRVLGATDGNATYLEIKGTLATAKQTRRVTYHILLGDPATNPGDFNVRRNTSYVVEADINGANAGDNRITVESFDMSNSAMVWPGSTSASVTFDVRKCLANTFTTEQQLASMLNSGAWRVEVLWQDVAKSQYDAGVNEYVTITYNEPGMTNDKKLGLFTVTPNSKTAGNAVVALYDNANSGGKILWSWHIWVTDYLPDGSKNYNLGINSKASVPGGQVHTYGEGYKKASDKIGGGPLRVIMDRNLGATGTVYDHPAAGREARYPTYGLFYQWGRPTPFPKAGDNDRIPDDTAPDGTTPSNSVVKDNVGTNVEDFPKLVAGPVTMAEALKNPQNFYYNFMKSDANLEPVYSDWQTPQNNACWGDGAAKSVYDPCPTGWRIAPVGTWDDFGKTWGNTFSKYHEGQSDTWRSADQTKAGGLYAVGGVKAFYSVPGCRGSGHITGKGTLWYVGAGGYNWSSSVSVNGAAYCLDFNSTWISPANVKDRAHGYPVRCIQE